MKIFLGTASPDEIRWATNPGLIDGVVTSAAAISAEDWVTELSGHLLELCRLVHGPVSVNIFTQCAKLGIDIAALSASVLRGHLVHPLSDRGLDELLSDWSRRLAKSRTGG